jgi:MYXO-CTERM domain-containing protein
MASRFEFSDLDWRPFLLFGFKIPVPVFLLTATLISFTELCIDSPFPVSHFFFPLFILFDRFLVESVSISSSFAFQVLLFVTTFHLLFLSMRVLDSLIILSFLISALAAAQRLEFAAPLIPILFYSLFLSRARFFAALGFAAAVSILIIADRTIGSPALCLNMTAGLRVRSFLRTDTNGLWLASALCAALAVRRRRDLFLGLALAVSAAAAMSVPVGSVPDRELSGVMAMRLIAYVWVARTIAQCPAWIPVLALSACVAAARTLRAVGWSERRFGMEAKW